MDNQRQQVGDQSLVLNEGHAYTKALEHLLRQIPHVSTEQDDYIITVFFQKAQGIYQIQPQGDIQWELPLPSQNLYIGVALQDKRDMRFIPDVLLYCHLYDADGNLVGDQRQYFVWHPYAFQYGSNWEIPKEGDYTPEVSIEKPPFPRLGQDKGEQYLEGVDVKFDSIHLIPGREEYTGTNATT